MIAQPLSSYAGRFVLPAVLLALAIGTWLTAAQMGDVDPGRANAGEAPAVAAPLSSVRRVPEFATSAQQAEFAALAIAALPNDPGGLSCATVLIDGEPVLDVRSDRALVPSYAQLVLTAHTAMDLLGPNYQYDTRVMVEELPDANGRLFSDVYLIGGGDPVLMSSTYARSFRPILSTRTPIEDLVTAMTNAGIVRIDGSVIAVENRYDQIRTLPGWPEDYRTRGVVGPLSALQLDDGLITRPSANFGVAVPADDPATLAAERFTGDLRDDDVQILGSARALRDDEELPSLVPVARLVSPPLSEIVFQMLAANDATASELILKELGVAESGEGTTQAGAQAVQRTLQQQGVDVPVPFRDASGLDPIASVSCAQLALAIDTIDDAHPTLDVLPAYNLPAVFDGALGDIDLASDLRLVGGVEGDSSGLVGRTVDQGRQVTIVSMINRTGGPSDADLAYQLALVEMVDTLRSSTTVEALALAE